MSYTISNIKNPGHQPEENLTTMEENMILYLSKAEVESVGVTMSEIIEELENAFREKGIGTKLPL